MAVTTETGMPLGHIADTYESRHRDAAVRGRVMADPMIGLATKVMSCERFRAIEFGGM